jgi:predicted permease
VRSFTSRSQERRPAAEEVEPVVAFVFSLLATIACAVVVVLYARRRPQGTPLSWGEAMVAAVFAFFAMFLAWGILPHQWLSYADNALQWRKDKILFGPAGIFDKALPFTLTYEVIRDVIAVGIYVLTSVVLFVLWAQWQRRGQQKPKELPTSAFGRPLVKKA